MKNLLFILLLAPFFWGAKCHTGGSDTIQNITDSIDTIIVNDTIVKSSDFYQLDTLTTDWRLTSDEILNYFSNAKQIDNEEAAMIVGKNYYPFSIEGEISCNSKDFQFIIIPSGVGILFSSSTPHKYQYYYDDIARSREGKRLNQLHSKGLKMLLLSQKKYCKYDECGEELGAWCRKWKLSVTDFNKYVSLCKQMPHHELYQMFQNCPCGFDGYLVWKGEVYRYTLEASAPLWLWNACKKVTSDEETVGFGCFVKAGEKYVFEVDPGMDK